MRTDPSFDVREHLPALLRYARALSRDEAQADDLVQQALVKAIERRASFQPGMALRPWLMAILHNHFIDRRRRDGLERRTLDALEGAPMPVPPTPPQEQQVYLQQVRGRFDALPEEQRAVLHLVAIEGLTYRDTADALGVPIGTVMSRLSRARAALREVDPDRVGRSGLRIIGGKDAG